MKKIFTLALIALGLSATAQQQLYTNQLYENAKTVMQKGDYESAAQILSTALQQDPNNYSMLKDYAFVNFLRRDFAKSINTAKTLVDRPDAEEQAFQILGMDYKAIAENDECLKLYKKGLKKFPNSGVLYNDYGELLATTHDMSGAIANWETGIRVAPGYSSNYYNAAMYYSRNPDFFWSLVYGELFINLESYSGRTAEVKVMLLENYRKLLKDGNLPTLIVSQKEGSFARTFLETLSRNRASLAGEASADQLTAWRTRFMLDWFNAKVNVKYPLRLFDNTQYLLRQGMFDAYNQWIFGTADSPSGYQAWVDAHDKQARDFKEFQEGRVFKPLPGQIYK